MSNTINGFNIPAKPDPSSVDFTDPKQAAAYQEASQNYHFAVDMMMNAIKQEGEAKSNLLKTINAGLDAHIRNLG
jgi:hypothetical protein